MSCPDEPLEDLGTEKKNDLVEKVIVASDDLDSESDSVCNGTRARWDNKRALWGQWNLGQMRVIVSARGHFEGNGTWSRIYYFFTVWYIICSLFDVVVKRALWVLIISSCIFKVDVSSECLFQYAKIFFMEAFQTLQDVMDSYKCLDNDVWFYGLLLILWCVVLWFASYIVRLLVYTITSKIGLLL